MDNSRPPPLKIAVVQVTAFMQNCSVLVCTATNRCAVVDPGGDIDRIRAAVDQTGAEVEKILLTHGHIDHAGGAGELAHALGVAVEGPQREDAFLIDDLEQQARHFGFPPATPFQPARWLEPGDNVTVGSVGFEVRHVPGHTPGHVVFYCEAARVLIAGDTVFRGSIGRTDFPRGDHDTLIRSIGDQILGLDDDVTILPGHGPITRVGEERARNPFLVDPGQLVNRS